MVEGLSIVAVIVVVVEVFVLHPAVEGNQIVVEHFLAVVVGAGAAAVVETHLVVYILAGDV